MNLTELINELDEELNGRKGLFNRRVDITRCVEIFEEIKRLLPPALTEAELVVKSREKILDNADTVAQNIIKEAEERAVHLSESSEVIKLAERQGRDMLDKTYRQCDALMQKTKEHLDEMFSETEAFFQSILNMLKTNRNELRGAVLNTGGRK